MSAKKPSTSQDQSEAIRIVLSGIAGDVDVGELAGRLYLLHPKNGISPGGVLLDLAADAIDNTGAIRDDPIELPNQGPAPRERVRHTGRGP